MSLCNSPSVLSEYFYCSGKCSCNSNALSCDTNSLDGNFSYIYTIEKQEEINN